MEPRVEQALQAMADAAQAALRAPDGAGRAQALRTVIDELRSVGVTPREQVPVAPRPPSRVTTLEGMYESGVAAAGWFAVHGA